MPEDERPAQVTIYRERAGGTTVTVTAGIAEDGALVMEGQDLGEAPLRYFGEDEYEYFVRVAPDDVARLLLALLQERFGTSTMPTSAFMEWLKERDIAYEFSSF